ncbi:MAG: outer membrane protein assembly factor BamA [Burkholderiales bacterium]|nr:outer membrane protein assembly factor BamA [Burkholderiales bacterium]
MKRIAALLVLAGLASKAFAFDPFVVNEIRIDGLSRISAGTVFSYLPLERGDRVDRARAAEAIRALYRTGFFRDVQITRQGDILVVTVAERPSISKIEITGNKDIKDEDLRRGLREVGLSEGETFDRLQLDRLTQELTRQYNNRGKYNVSIKPTIKELERNRVEIVITVVEGKAAKIRHLNIVGNETFSDEDLREDFESGTTNWTSWYSRDDQYSREKLSGDLERVTSYYQDRGYVDFNVESTQVSISPDKREIFLTLNVREGETYTISDLKLTGDLILPAADLERFIIAKPGEIFSRRKLELTSEAISKVLANIGYAFADVTPVPTVDRENRTVAINFFVNPGKRVYVRRVNFQGNTRTQDEVLRRELRQFEGAWFSQAAIDRSKIRLQRLGYFKSVEVETPRVPGSEDQVDVVIKVEEQSSGAFQFGVGYSQLQGVLTSVSVTQRNFLGTGNSVGLTVQNNAIVRRFDFNYFDPYFTDDGISIGYNLSLRELDQSEANIANFTSDVASGQILFGVPLTETDTVTFTLGADRNQITASDGFTPQTLIDQLVRQLGDRRKFPCDDETQPANPDDCENFGPFRQWTVNTWRLSAFWARDSRNRFFAPTRGSFQRLGIEAAMPGSDLEYYKLTYDVGRYWPLNDWLTLLTKTELGYGDGYGDTDELPFFENYYAGGVTAGVRGFRDNTLGPCDESVTGFFGLDCQPLGGAFRTVSTAEFIFPTPFTKRNDDSTQLSAFIDVGNVFTDFDAFETGELRASAGLSFKWQAPVGPIVLNLSVPLRREDDDRIERLQFSFGGNF